MLFRRRTAFERELRSIRKSSARTAFCVVLLVSGIAPAVSMWWEFGESGVNSHQFLECWSVFLRTYPLTLSVALIAMSRKLRWFGYGRVLFMLAVITVGATLADTVGMLTGQQHKNVLVSNAVQAPEHLLLGPLVNSVNYLVGYYELYGARYFLASVIFGSFVGRTASKLLMHVPREVGKIASPDAPVVEPKRRAA